MSKKTARTDLKSKTPILVDLYKCDLCGGCVGVCPPNCIEMSERSLSIVGSECIKCGLCIPVCPVAALSWDDEELPAKSGIPS